MARVLRVSWSDSRISFWIKKRLCSFANLEKDASEFAQNIRGHWGVENKLHWVKDVVQIEDNNGNYSINNNSNQNFPHKFLVGAPFHFYFGIIKGESALDKFKTKYLADEYYYYNNTK